jgi:antitoxin component HigA of HigAB toxin-antitoxin module
MSRPSTSLHRLPRKFSELSGLHMLRPIHDQVDLENARELVDALAVLKTRTADQDDYLETLSTLIEKYEAEQNALDTSSVTPMDALRSLMEGHDMSASDLGRLLGNRELGAAILRGDRQLSKKHITILAKHFAVSTDLFLSALE